jgi:large subunit ribosomal protein L2
MAIKKYKPTSPGRRWLAGQSFEEVTRDRPEKSLVRPLHKNAGRNAYGRITVRHRGGGHARQYRLIDFRRDKFDVPARVDSIEYDPNRSARIALLVYADGEKRYILAPLGLRVGNTVVSSRKSTEIYVGNSMPLDRVPLGTLVHNVELYPGRGGQLVRAAGAAAQVLAKEGDYITLRLPSTEMRRCVVLRCRRAITPMVVAKAVHRSGWLGRNPRGDGVPWAGRHVVISQLINTSSVGAMLSAVSKGGKECRVL